MSMEDLFGSDLEDSEDEKRGKSRHDAAEKAQMDELFGDSSSDDERKQRESGDDEEVGAGTPVADAEEDEIKGDDDDDNVVDGGDDDDDDGEEQAKQRHMSSTDLFGEDLSSDEEQRPQKELGVGPEEERAEPAEPEQRATTGEGKEQEEEEEEAETRIDVTIPYCRFTLGAELFFVKTPNFLSMECKPFDPSLYEDEMEDEEILDEEGRARLKLKVENTIRWRYSKDKDGNEIKESNARIVKWSDGTMSLLLGGEVFDIHKTKIDGDFNHLFVQQGTGLQGQAVFKEKLTFRPHSTASQTHRKMTLSIADRASKAQKIRILPAAGKDPEAMRSELIKKEEERLRSQVRRESQQRRMRERSHSKGLSASFLERDDDDEDLEQSLMALKKKYKKKLAQGSDDDDEEEEETEDDNIIDGLESEDEEEGQERLRKAKEGIESGEESDGATRKRTFTDEGAGGKKKKKSRQIVESDVDDSD